MKFFVRTLLWAVAAVTFAAGSAHAIKTAPTLPHNTYDFTYSNTSDATIHDSGIGGPVSGYADSVGGTADKGQIVIDVLGAPPNGALIVSVSEQARYDRSAAPATCTVWGTTNVVCDGTKKVNEEEFSLLRFLGRNFIDAAQIDAKNHWSAVTTAKDLVISNDFTIDKNDGASMHIVESRIVKQAGAQAFTASTDGTIVYNEALTVPSEITEQTMTRQSIGMGDYSTDRSQLQLKLTSDSLVGKASQ
jgi:hypothetical protein